MMRALLLAAAAGALFAGYNADEAIAGGNQAAATAQSGRAASGRPFTIQPVTKFNEPWAMAFLPNGSALVTEKPGRLVHWANGRATPVAGTPKVDYGGQLGLGDVVLHPRFARNRLVYLSWSEPGPNDTRGAAVGRARLVTTGGTPRLEGMQVIWRQDKTDGRFHHAHRLAFAPDGHLFITSGDRMKFEPAQDLSSNWGKLIRLRDDGSVPKDNPFAARGGTAAQVWSYGHRNSLGIAFAPNGQLWTHEMGPRHGDELNRIERGTNYGWPTVSNGDHYDGRAIPDHPKQPRFNAPEASWVPAISPAGLIFYTGSAFPQWRGNAFIGGLSAKTLVRVAIDGAGAREVERFDMGQRIREVEQGPDGAIYVLEDERKGSGGRLLRLTPAK